MPTTSHPADRRQLILETTLKLIARGGVDSVTHRRVADAANIPLGSTTYYFKSRDHLLREAFDHYLTQATQMQEALANGLIESEAELVDYLVAVTQREFEQEETLLAEYELTLFAARDAHVAAALHQWDAMLIKRIARALRGLGASSPTDGAHTVLNLMRGYELDRLTRHRLASSTVKFIAPNSL